MNRKVTVLAILLVVLASVAGAQDSSAEPTFGTVELEAGFLPDPQLYEIVAGGSIDLNDVGFAGYVADAPDFNLYYDGDGSTLLIYVVGAEYDTDTVILVNAPDGEWYFNDDWDGVNAGLEFPDADSGLYNVWIGTYDEGESVETIVAISEMSM